MHSMHPYFCQLKLHDLVPEKNIISFLNCHEYVDSGHLEAVKTQKIAGLVSSRIYECNFVFKLEPGSTYSNVNSGLINHGLSIRGGTPPIIIIRYFLMVPSQLTAVWGLIQGWL